VEGLAKRISQGYRRQQQVDNEVDEDKELDIDADYSLKTGIIKALRVRSRTRHPRKPTYLF
jgi:hypothetical protein